MRFRPRLNELESRRTPTVGVTPTDPNSEPSPDGPKPTGLDQVVVRPEVPEGSPWMTMAQLGLQWVSTRL